MSEKHLDIIVAAKNEASGTFNRVNSELRSIGESAGGAEGRVRGLFGSFKELNAESRASGEMAFERLLRGGGALGLATFAIEGLGRAAEATRAALDEVATGEITAGQAAGKITEGFAEGIPVFGTWVKGLRSIEDAVQDVASAIAVANGEDKNWADNNLTSAATVQKRAEELNKAIDKSNESLRKASDEAKLSGLRGRAREEAEEDIHYREATQKRIKEQEETLKGHKNDAEYQNVKKSYSSEQQQIDKAHENRLLEIQQKPLKIDVKYELPNLTESHSERFSALAEIAKEKFALLAGQNPLEQLQREGNQVNREGWDFLRNNFHGTNPANPPPPAPPAPAPAAPPTPARSPDNSGSPYGRGTFDDAVDFMHGKGDMGAETGKLPGFASGVQNFRGGMAVVGENGPEIVELPPGSNVVPNPTRGALDAAKSPLVAALTFSPLAAAAEYVTNQAAAADAGKNDFQATKPAPIQASPATSAVVNATHADSPLAALTFSPLAAPAQYVTNRSSEPDRTPKERFRSRDQIIDANANAHRTPGGRDIGPIALDAAKPATPDSVAMAAESGKNNFQATKPPPIQPSAAPAPSAVAPVSPPPLSPLPAAPAPPTPPAVAPPPNVAAPAVDAGDQYRAAHAALAKAARGIRDTDQGDEDPIVVRARVKQKMEEASAAYAARTGKVRKDAEIDPTDTQSDIDRGRSRAAVEQYQNRAADRAAYEGEVEFHGSHAHAEYLRGASADQKGTNRRLERERSEALDPLQKHVDELRKALPEVSPALGKGPGSAYQHREDLIGGAQKEFDDAKKKFDAYAKGQQQEFEHRTHNAAAYMDRHAAAEIKDFSGRHPDSPQIPEGNVTDRPSPAANGRRKTPTGNTPEGRPHPGQAPYVNSHSYINDARAAIASGHTHSILDEARANIVAGHSHSVLENIQHANRGGGGHAGHSDHGSTAKAPASGHGRSAAIYPTAEERSPKIDPSQMGQLVTLLQQLVANTKPQGAIPAKSITGQ